jgi:hypothetical protein
MNWEVAMTEEKEKTVREKAEEMILDKLGELSEDELDEVAGGIGVSVGINFNTDDDNNQAVDKGGAQNILIK